MSRHFVFVHGASHGGWCWYKVAAQLESAGHTVTTLDMAASGLNPKHVHDVNSLSDYAQPLLDFLEGLQPTEKVVLVGHSMGGTSICLAMEKYPHKISAGVFLAAIMLPPTSATTQRLTAHPLKKTKPLTAHDIAHKDAHLAAYHKSNFSVAHSKYLYGDGPNNAPTATMQMPEFLKSNYYRLSPPEDYALGKRLWRYLPVKAQFMSDLVLTEENYGSVPRVYIICDPETAMSWQQLMISIFPPKEVITLQGSDHMAMFSKPDDLVSYLQVIGEKYP